jgi:hypothetical protein
VSSNSETAIERICQLEGALSRVPAGSVAHRRLAQAIAIHADQYRKALDAEQAAEQFDPKP